MRQVKKEYCIEKLQLLARNIKLITKEDEVEITILVSQDELDQIDEMLKQYVKEFSPFLINDKVFTHGYNIREYIYLDVRIIFRGK